MAREALEALLGLVDADVRVDGALEVQQILVQLLVENLVRIAF
jgi:hypothetical protein